MISKHELNSDCGSVESDFLFFFFPAVIYLILWIQSNKKSGQKLLAARTSVHSNTPGSWRSATHALVPFAAAWAEVRGDISCLAQGHLGHGWRWRWGVPFVSFSPSFLSLIRTPTPPSRSLSGTDLLPFPTTAMTQMRLLYHCQQRLTGLASLSVVVGPSAPASVLRPRSPCWISGPTHCFFFLGWEVFFSFCAITHTRSEGGRSGEKRVPFQLSRASLTSGSVNSNNKKRGGKRTSMWASIRLTYLRL